jgi:hypothetical protein
MQRKSGGKSSGKKGDKQGRGGGRDHPSVHYRNLQILAFPLIILFTVIRALAFQIWVVLVFIYRHRHLALPCKIQKASATDSIHDKVQLSEAESSGQGHSLADGGGGDMASRKGDTTTVVQDPAVDLQKYYHRRAFEHISKALKIDEEDKGKLNLNSCILFVILVGLYHGSLIKLCINDCMYMYDVGLGIHYITIHDHNLIGLTLTYLVSHIYNFVIILRYTSHVMWGIARSMPK